MLSSLGYYVGYNYFIDVDGTRTKAREHDEETAANKGHNCDASERCDTISVCLAGDFNKEHPLDVQTKELQKLYHELSKEFELKVGGHRDIQANRTCPGTLIQDSYYRLIAQGTTGDTDLEDLEKQRLIEEQAQEIKDLQQVIQQLILWIKSYFPQK